jgi:hypothetical protein
MYYVIRKMKSTHDVYDTITVSTTSTRTYYLDELDRPTYDNPKETYDQHLTLHNLVSFKEETQTNKHRFDNDKALRILNNSGRVSVAHFYDEKMSSFAVLEKGTHKIDPENAMDTTMKTNKRISPEIEGVSCILTSDKSDPIYTKPNYSSFL